MYNLKGPEGHDRFTFRLSRLIVCIALLVLLSPFALTGRSATVYLPSVQPESFTSTSAGNLGLLTQSGSNRGLALESITQRTEPFAPTSETPFGPDNRTRIILFASNLPSDDP